MVRTKPRPKYQAVSLPKDFVKEVKKHVKKNNRFNSIAEFTEKSVREKMYRESDEYKRNTEETMIKKVNELNKKTGKNFIIMGNDEWKEVLYEIHTRGLTKEEMIKEIDNRIRKVSLGYEHLNSKRIKTLEDKMNKILNLLRKS